MKHFYCLFGLLSFSLLLMGSLASAQVPTASEMPAQIGVVGESWVWLPRDTARLTVELSEVGNSADEAARALLNKKISLKVAVGKKAANAFNFIDQGLQLKGGEAKSSWQAVEVLLIETKKFDLLGTLVDELRKVALSPAAPIEYLSRAATKEKEAALKEASARAREQAQTISKSLGVNLLSLLSATVNEEPSGTTLRLTRDDESSEEQTGEVGEYHVLVSLQYKVGAE